jgi:hypothetical protein
MSYSPEQLCTGRFRLIPDSPLDVSAVTATEGSYRLVSLSTGREQNDAVMKLTLSSDMSIASEVALRVRAEGVSTKP